MKIKIRSQKFIDIIKALANVNTDTIMVVDEKCITFQSLDPMRMAVIKIKIPSRRLSMFKTDIDGKFQFNIADLMDDIIGIPTGYIYLEINSNSSITIKTNYYTTKYDISEINEESRVLTTIKEDINEMSIPVPPALMDFIKLLKRRGIDKITMKEEGNKLRLVGKGSKTYTTTLDITAPSKKFGTTSVSVLWLHDILITMSDISNVYFCFSSLSNLYLRDDNDDFISEAILAGTVKKIMLPDDLPDINTNEIDEGANSWEW